MSADVCDGGYVCEIIVDIFYDIDHKGIHF